MSDIKTISERFGGRVYYIPSVKREQLPTLELILGEHFTKMARYYEAGETVFTLEELPKDIKQSLDRAGYEALTGLHKV
jgi:hypothetical protein